MRYSFLIVEDQPLLAMEVEDAVVEQGHKVAAIATNKLDALSAAPDVDIAIVDVNLSDGPTGPEIGETLARELGITVLFMTSDPNRLTDGVPGTIGVLAKPASPDELAGAISYLAQLRVQSDAKAPLKLTLFERPRSLG